VLTGGVDAHLLWPALVMNRVPSGRHLLSWLPPSLTHRHFGVCCTGGDVASRQGENMPQVEDTRPIVGIFGSRRVGMSSNNSSSSSSSSRLTDVCLPSLHHTGAGCAVYGVGQADFRPTVQAQHGHPATDPRLWFVHPPTQWYCSMPVQRGSLQHEACSPSQSALRVFHGS
jgi:hypothetical protein